MLKLKGQNNLELKAADVGPRGQTSAFDFCCCSLTYINILYCLFLTKHTLLPIYYSQPGALQIEQSEESDQGKYECVATNNDGTRYSAPANLYVRGRKAVLTAPACF